MINIMIVFHENFLSVIFMQFLHAIAVFGVDRVVITIVKPMMKFVNRATQRQRKKRKLIDS
jgi:hypothetical protein